MSKLDTLQSALESVLVGRIKKLVRDRGEISVTVGAADYADAVLKLRDDPALKFEQLIDLCGVDYSGYKDQPWDGPRFCVVSHLLSITHNWRVRLKVFCPDDEVPTIASVTEVWSAANWFEREAFDLYGIIFEGHLDLRRILTDYGFIGHSEPVFDQLITVSRLVVTKPSLRTPSMPIVLLRHSQSRAPFFHS